MPLSGQSINSDPAFFTFLVCKGYHFLTVPRELSCPGLGFFLPSPGKRAENSSSHPGEQSATTHEVSSTDFPLAVLGRKGLKHADSKKHTNFIVKGFSFWKLPTRAFCAALMQSWDYPVQARRQKTKGSKCCFCTPVSSNQNSALLQCHICLFSPLVA